MKKVRNDDTESYGKLMNIVEGYGNAKCISIISNSGIEGKSMIAKNFAMTLAKGGKKTLFIDCNFTSISNIDITNSDKSDGLIGILEVINMEYISDLELKDYISDTQCEYLSMLKLGNYKKHNYISVLKRDYLRLAIERLKISFDYIIIDVPVHPSKDFSFTQIVSEAADECLFFSKEGINEIS
jgi:Mrp family chromosome partitioning ATPase